MNSFTVEEIKQSVYYQWRMHHIKTYMAIWGVIAVFSLLVTFFVTVGVDSRLLVIAFVDCGVVVVIFGLFLGVFALYDYSKARSFVRHYKNFKQYETVLDSPETSYWYRGAIYYNVRIKDDNTSVLACTNACFSGRLFSKFTLEDYNNKKVVGLLDPESERFYVVKIVG